MTKSNPASLNDFASASRLPAIQAPASAPPSTADALAGDDAVPTTTTSAPAATTSAAAPASLATPASTIVAPLVVRAAPKPRDCDWGREAARILSASLLKFRLLCA